MHFADFAKLPRCDHGTGLFDERIAGVVVRHAAEHVAVDCERCEFLCVRNIGRHRFVDEHVEACVDERTCDFIVRGVGGDDGHQIEARFADFFAPGDDKLVFARRIEIPRTG